jgi:DNA-binding CsgD family transcriptional regulator/tetratricopeptide (TPR) repeat protein
MHGFPASLTSFVGRAQATAEIAAQLAECRLVTVTGPGGAGKTRLAGEVARRVAGRFADGVWLAELAAVRDPAQVPAAVAAALGIHDLPVVAAADALAHALARRQLLLMLDNCEQVIGAAAEVCGRLLLGADDVRVLATSREPLRIAGEAASLRQLDAEDVTLRRALDWAMEHDPDTALRLALSQAPLWSIRGRLISHTPVLAAAAEHAETGSGEWCGARMLLAQAASYAADPVAAMKYYVTVKNVLEDPERPASWEGPVLLSLCLGGRSVALLQLGRVAEALDDARQALAVARQAGSQGLAASALTCLGAATWQAGDRDGALRLAREAQGIPDEFAGGLYRAISQFVTMILTETGDLAGAEQACAAGLASCREVGDLANLSGQLWNRTILDLRAGRADDAAANLGEQLQIAVQTGMRPSLMAGLDCCGHLCAATRRPAEAITVWAAASALRSPGPLPHESRNLAEREELQRNAREQLGPAGTRAAEERGAAMSLATAAEYALLLAAAQPPAGPPPAPAPALPRLSPRERELITLVAQGRTDAQIATQLYITVRTVTSHLDRIRDKTGCRRRADLTRLALTAGLV